MTTFDTNYYLMSTDEVTANILHLAQNMEEEFPGAGVTAPGGPTPHLCIYRCLT
jgi:hypothetical protein